MTGATISKVINRGMATAVAGFFALGMEMVADDFDGGYEAVIISLSVMVVGEFPQVILTQSNYNKTD